MSDNVKIALIAAGALLLAVVLYLYFSPYHSCVRAYGEGSEMACAQRSR